MYSFINLSKYCKKNTTGMSKYNIALLGDCATQHMAKALKGYAYTKKVNVNIFDADYDQILPQIIDENSEMYNSKPDSVLIFMCVERLYEQWVQTSEEKRSTFAETWFDQIKVYWEYISFNSSAKILQFTFAEYDDRVFGNYASKIKASFIYQLRKLNLMLMDGCMQDKNTFLIDLNNIQSSVGRDVFYDSKLYYLAKMPISLAALPRVAASVIDVIQTFRGEVKKCVILDLDNTLWGGVIGDDGLAGIQIGELGIGHAFTGFQEWIKELKKRGILLGVCSKNEETAAKLPFEKHDEMVLKLKDFSIFVANWEDKASNIRHIQETLNIGMDSIIFIDDNPFERNLVRSLLPDVIVPELPDDPALYLTYLQSLNLFETFSFSQEDAKRTNLYQAEAKRNALSKQYSNFDEYLQNLEMVARAAEFDVFHTPRIAQLSQRSNQFNLRTIRYTEAEIESIVNDNNQITMYFTLKDKLADHGLISIVIMEKKDNESLFIKTWLMSCRVLKRGMEEFIVNKIIETAKKMGYKTVIGEYIKTQKNTMVKDIYEKLGFARISDNTFVCDVDNFKANKTNIKEQRT